MCLYDYFPDEAVTLLPCAHLYHTEVSRGVVPMWGLYAWAGCYHLLAPSCELEPVCMFPVRAFFLVPLLLLVVVVMVMIVSAVGCCSCYLPPTISRHVLLFGDGMTACHRDGESLCTTVIMRATTK